MAATKKSIAIQGQKRELAREIQFLNAQTTRCCAILSGSVKGIAWRSGKFLAGKYCLSLITRNSSRSRQHETPRF